MKREPVQLICSSLLIFLFTYTSVSKLFDYPQFVRVLGESPLIHNGADMIGRLLPVTELVIVLLLFFPATRKTGFVFSFFLLLLFTLYLIYMLLFAADLPCSCGGVLSKMSWKQHVWFNVFFIVVSVLGIYSNQKERIDLKRYSTLKELRNN